MTRRNASVLALCLLLGPVASPADAPPDPLDAAMREFTRAIEDARAALVADPTYADPQQRAAGMAYLNSMLLRTIEAELVQDADYPYFRVIDPRVREGGDNPDQRYLAAPLRGGERYRIWGHRGGARRIDFQVYAGEPWRPGAGSMVAGLNLEQVHFGRDGSFEVIVSPQPEGRDWLRTTPEATSVMVRQTYSNWPKENGGDVHIDRIGLEGASKPRVSDAEMIRRLESAAKSLRSTVPNWPRFVRSMYLERRPPNTLSKPAGATAGGGMPGRLYGSGHFDLADDEALVITAWDAPGNYQGVQLTDLYFASLEYANRQTSLTLDQAYRSADGAYRLVVSAQDPGVQNWLDTTGLRRGVILMRFDGLGDQTIPAGQEPTAVKIKLADLWTVLPASTPRYGAEARRAALAARRQHVQLRFDD